MTGAADVRELLDSVAASAPRLDLADRAIRGADARRRRRIGGVATAATAAALVTVVAISVQGTPNRPVAPGWVVGAAGLRYEPDITVPPSGVDDLPVTLTEAIAFALSGFDSGEALSDDRVVTVSGAVYRIPGSGRWAPMVSPDGSVLLFYDEDEEALVSRNVRSGTSLTFSSAGSMAQLPETAYWSPDGHRLAIISGQPFGEADASVFDVLTGAETQVATDGMTVGWADEDSLLVMRTVQGIDSVPATFLEVDLDGRAHDRQAADLQAWLGLTDISLSPDKATLAAVSDYNGGSLVVIDRGQLDEHGYGGASVVCSDGCGPMLPAAWASDREIVAARTGPTSGQRVIAVDVDTGDTRDLATISAARYYSVTFASDVLEAGPRNAPSSAGR